MTLIRRIYGVLIFDFIAVCLFSVLMYKIPLSYFLTLYAMTKSLYIIVAVGLLILFIVCLVTFEMHKSKYLKYVLRIMITLMLSFIGAGIAIRIYPRAKFEMMCYYSVLMLTCLLFTLCSTEFYFLKPFMCVLSLGIIVFVVF